MADGWNDCLPPPPREVYDLVEQARDLGFWLFWARHAYHQRLQGGRYRLSREGSREPLYVANDLSAIRAWLWARTN